MHDDRELSYLQKNGTRLKVLERGLKVKEQ